MLLMLGLAAFAAALPLLVWGVQAQLAGRAALRTLGSLAGRDAAVGGPGAGRRVLPGRATFVAVGGKLVPNSKRAAVAQLLARAGDGRSVEDFLAVKAMAAAGGVVVALWLGRVGPVGLLVGAAAGWSLFSFPEVRLRRRAEDRASVIVRSLSDSLDLLAIAVEAGAGLDGALARVAEDVDGPLGDEYRQVLDEMRLGASRREALVAMKDRLAIPEVGAFVLSVVQADAVGMPLARILRAQAVEMRARRRRRAREQAAKTPVKILFPLVFGIFPSMLIVILGPAALRIFQMVGAQ